MAVRKITVAFEEDVWMEGLAAQELGAAPSFSAWVNDRVKASRQQPSERIRSLTGKFAGLDD